MKRALVGMALVGVLAGCDNKTPVVPHADATAGDPSSTPLPTVTVPAPMPSATASSGGRLLDLVSGRGAPDGIPEASTEAGHPFDFTIRHRLTMRPVPGPRLEIKALKTTAGLPPEVVTRMVRAGFAQLRRCYEAALTRDDDAEGSQGLSFVIDRTGQVSSATAIAPAFPDKALSPCATAAVRQLQFPEPSSPSVTVTLEMAFRVE